MNGRLARKRLAESSSFGLWGTGAVFEGAQTGGKDEDEVRTAAENKFEQHAMGRKELLTWQRLVCDKGLIRRVLVATSLASPAAIGEAGGASLSVECTAADGNGSVRRDHGVCATSSLTASRLPHPRIGKRPR